MPRHQLREIETLRTLQEQKHPNIVGFYGLVSEDDEHSKQAFILLELCATTLEQVIKTAYQEHVCKEAATGDGTGIGRLKTLSIACDIAAGLLHCHQRNIMHRDLKPENVLLDTDGRAKLCDFGMSSSVCFERPLSPQMITLWYRAPEVLLGSEHYGLAVDVWALGCILFQMCWLKAPFIAQREEMKMLEVIFDAFGVPSSVHDAPVRFEYTRGASVVPERIAQSGALAGVLGQMLQLEPLARPTAQAALAALTGLRVTETEAGSTATQPPAQAALAAVASLRMTETEAGSTATQPPAQAALAAVASLRTPDAQAGTGSPDPAVRCAKRMRESLPVD